MNAPDLARTQVAAAAAEHTESDLDRLLRADYIPKARDFVMSTSAMEKIYRFARFMSEGTITTPEHLRGKIGDCVAIVMQAMLWNMDPFAVAQKTHVVSGRLGYEAQLVNAVMQQSGAIVGAPRYEFEMAGQVVKCRVGCVLPGDREPTWGEWLSSADVTTKNSPLWKTNPRQQMGYLQLKNWARLYTPGAILGVQTVDELMDVPDPLLEPPPPPPPAGPKRKSAAAAAPEASPAPPPHDPETGEVEPPPPPAAAAPAPAAEPAPAPAQTDAPVRPLIGPGQVSWLKGKIAAGLTTEAAILERYEVNALSALTVECFDELKSEIVAKG